MSLVVTVFVAAWVWASAAVAGAQPLPAAVPIESWGPAGDVHAVARAADTLYLGGSFRYVGPHTGPLAVFDNAGAVRPAEAVAGQIQRVASAGAFGRIVLGTILVPDDPVPVRALAKVDVDGRVVPDWHVGVVGVTAIETDGATLYLAGAFSTVNGQARQGLAAVNVETGALLPWAPTMIGAIREMQISNGLLLLTGELQSANGVPVTTGFAAFDLATGATHSFDIAPLVTVDAVATWEGTLYLAGQLAGGVGPSGLRIDIGNGTPQAWNVTVAGIQQLVTSPTQVFARTTVGVVALGHLGGGAYGNPLALGGSAPIDMARGADRLWVATAGSDEYAVHAFSYTSLAALHPPFLADWFIEDVDPDGGSGLILAGMFRSAGGVARRGLVGLDVRSGMPTAGALPSVDGTVVALAIVGNVLVVGGESLRINGVDRGGLIALDRQSGAMLPWEPVPSGSVAALAVDAQRLYVGGQFQAFAGAPRRNLAAVSLATVQVETWTPDPNGGVRALLATGTAVIAGGEFTTIGGTARGFGAAFAADTLALSAWDPQASGPVYRLAVAAGRVAIAGPFREAAGQPANDFAVFDNSGARVAAVQAPQRLSTVTGLSGGGSEFALAGIVAFTNQSPVALVSATSGREAGWTPFFEEGGMPVAAGLITRYPDLVVVTGRFSRVGGVRVNNVGLFPLAPAGAPVQLRARVVGNAVTLGWAPPPGTSPQGYRLDAMLGAGNLGSFSVAATTVSATLGAGTYSVRVGAVIEGVIGLASAPIVFTVPAPAAPPTSPTGLTATVSAGVVRLTWSAAAPGPGAGNLESFVIEAGSTSGAANLAVLDTGTLDTTFATGAPAGTYYVRVRAKNTFGVSPPSHEVVLSVP